MEGRTTRTAAERENVVRDNGAAYMAYRALHVAFVVAPIVAGADKFFHLLVEWPGYLAPWIPDLFGMSGSGFMMIIGAIEIVAGLLVLFRPRLGGYVVSAWLIGIIVNLLTIPDFYDIALRDLGLALGAFALAKLATAFGD